MRKCTLFILTAVAFAAIISSCNSTYGTRKRGYYKINFPKREYVKFDKEGFPYSFEYPAYATIVRDTTYFDTTPENPFWVNVDFPQFKGRIFLSYKKVGGLTIYKTKGANGQYKDTTGINIFEKMVNDAFNMTNKNNVAATYIRDSLVKTPNGIHGVFFKVGGNAATAKQFFLSDTTKNFIRGALYFEATPNADSIKPVQDFIQADLEHLINTFKWK